MDESKIILPMRNNWIKNLFHFPIFKDDEKTRIAKILIVVLWSMIVLVCGLILTWIATGKSDELGPYTYLANTVIIVMAIALLFLTYHGYVKTVSIIFTVVLWGNITFQAFTSDGIRGSAAIIYMAIMVLASLLIGWRASIGFAILSIGFIWILAYEEMIGSTTFQIDSPYEVALETTVIFVFTAVLLTLTTTGLINALKRAMKSERSLKETNLSLHNNLKELANREEALRESEEKYRILIESMKDVIVQLSPTGHLLYVSPGIKEFGGYNSENEIGNHMSKYFANKTDIIRATELIADVLETPHSGRFEFEFKPNDREPFPVELTFTPIFGEDGEVKEIQIALRDISERKRAEKTIQKNAEFLKNILEALAHPFYVINVDDYSLAMANSTALHDYNLRNGLTCHKLSHNSDNPCTTEQHQCPLEEMIRTKTPVIVEHMHYNKNGDPMIVEVHAHPIFDDKGNVVQMIEYNFDITERKKAEEESRNLEEKLVRSQKMEAIGTLAGGIAHDFNNILFPISGYAEMLLLDAPGDSPLHHGLSEILVGVKRAGDLAKQILTFSRQREHELKPLKVEIVVKEALKLIRSSLPTTIEIRQNVNKDYGLVMADPTQIHQIVMNLITNSYHAMEETGGNLNVTLKEVELEAGELIDSAMDPGSYVCLTVADTGMGMDQSVKDRIFDPYFTTKEEGKGTGLGLSVVHGIVKSHGGHISVYSEPGKGTEFKVYLPVIKEQKETEKVETDTPIQKGDDRILLVDDQDIIVQIEKQMLERLGYHVTARSSSTDALEAFQMQPDKYDLVITDLTMPNMTGDKLAQKLMAIRPDIPVILCTGFSEKMSKEKAEALGIEGFLMKPVVMKDLSGMIRKVLDKK